jgi:hypothetical protein
MSKSNSIVMLTLLLGIVLFGSVVFLLVTWQDIDAVLYAVLGAAAGWCGGMLIAPYPEEKERFAKFLKTLSAFLTGYLVSKIETLWGFMTDSQHRGVFFETVFQRRVGICVTCLLLVGAAVFKSRSYLHRGVAQPEMPTEAGRTPSGVD